MVALVLGAGVSIVGVTYEDNGDVTRVDDETVTISDPITETANSNKNVTYLDRTNISKGQERFIEGEDYQWVQSNGTIKLTNDSDITPGNSYSVSYQFVEQTDQQERLLSLWTGSFEAASYVPLVLIVAALLAAVSAFGRVAS
jgi:hypothetical protein